MNQPIFVHANSDNLPPITVSIPPAVDSSSQKSAKSPSVGAVIRPTRQGTNLDSVRVDTPTYETFQGPHVRTNKLEDYVKWLRADAASKRTANLQKKLTTPDVVLPTSGSESAEFDNYVPKPSRGFAVEQIQRVDGAHGSLNAPVTNANNFLLDPDWQKLQAHLLGEAEHLTELAQVQSETDRPFANHHNSVAPSSANHVDPDDIIRTVAQAIASVLTDQSEESIRQRIRQQLDTTAHDETLASLPAEDARETSAEIADSVETNSGSGPIGSQARPPHFETSAIASNSETVSRQDQEIPTTIAAWDVEDFRWPTITNQMIVAGSEAIAQLANSVFKLMGTSGRRLAITSPGRGEGTTSIAISMARWAAASGKKVLLVDADLASPGLSGQVGLGPNISWVNAVSNSLDPCEVIIRSQKTSVCVMPMTPIVTRVTWPRFIYDSLGALTEKVESSFDLILFDVGPTSQLIAELSKSNLMIDAGLIVHNGSGTSNFQKAKDRLQEFGISKYLVAQNSVRQASAHVA